MSKHALLHTPRRSTEGLESDSPELQSLAALAALAALGALAQRTRLSIARLLIAREPSGMAAGSIARAVQAPQNTVSSHLGVLANADLVIGVRQGRSIIYRANVERIRALIEYLVSNCCNGAGSCEHLFLSPVCATPHDRPSSAARSAQQHHSLKDPR